MSDLFAPVVSTAPVRKRLTREQWQAKQQNFINELNAIEAQLGTFMVEAGRRAGKRVADVWASSTKFEDRSGRLRAAIRKSGADCLDKTKRRVYFSGGGDRLKLRVKLRVEARHPKSEKPKSKKRTYATPTAKLEKWDVEGRAQAFRIGGEEFGSTLAQLYAWHSGQRARLNWPPGGQPALTSKVPETIGEPPPDVEAA